VLVLVLSEVPLPLLVFCRKSFQGVLRSTNFNVILAEDHL
jgi:hypothetical protein